MENGEASEAMLPEGASLADAADDEEAPLAEVLEAGGSSGFLHTLFNGINVMCGVGLLATPYTAAQMGWSSLVLLCALGCMFLYTGKLIGECMADASWIRTYPDIGQHAFGARGRIAIAALLYAELFFTATEFLIMEGDNLSALAPGFSPFAGSLGSPHRAWVIVAALIMLPTVMLRDLSLLAYLSAAGIFASVITAALVGWEGRSDGLPYRDLPLLRPGGVPLVVGMLSFNFGGHALFPSLYAAMRSPEQYPRVLDITFLGVTALYAITAVLGYLAFGDTVEENVTLSMEQRHPVALPTRVAVWITIISPFTKYALVMTPIAGAIEARLIPAMQSSSSCKLLPGQLDPQRAADRRNAAGWRAVLVSLGVRTALVIGSVAVALSVPRFAYVMAFTGGLLGLMACVVVPALCYLQIKRRLLGRVEMTATAMLACMGVALSITGTASAVLRIINS